MYNSAKNQKIKNILEDHYKIERYSEWNKYQGFDRDTKEPVSFSIIYNLFESKYNVWKVLEEIEKNSLYNHSNIIRLLNIKTSQQIDQFDTIIFVMESLETNLKEIINSQHELNVENRRYIIHQILRGLRYLRTKNVVHGHLRPDKIIVDSNYKLKIDALNYDNHFYNHCFRSPESLMNQSEDFSSDIWSAGCIFYELIEGKTLFPGRNVMNQLSTIAKTIGSPDENDLKFIQKVECLNSLKKVGDVDWYILVDKGTCDEVDLIRMMLKWDPSKRISVEDAMKHPYFKLLNDDSDLLFCSQIDISYPKRMQYDKLPKYLWNKIQEIRENNRFK